MAKTDMSQVQRDELILHISQKLFQVNCRLCESWHWYSV